ncbi:transcriptional regulator domain-containing protein [Acidocella sp.]|uniref:transcriptional regulator domain-containing protein n=1 Tax=Acidocella sp. TaxID=50710 RepID=UPI00344BE717
MPGNPDKFAPPDWRDAQQYSDLLELDRSGWAWEWLRRHAAYEGDTSPLVCTRGDGILTPRFEVLNVSDNKLSGRWGLCFRYISKLPRNAGAATLERPI